MGAESFAGPVNALFDRLGEGTSRAMMMPEAVAGAVMKNEAARRALREDAETRNALQGVQSLEDLSNAIPALMKANPTVGINAMSQLVPIQEKAQKRRDAMMNDAYQILSSVRNEPDPQRRSIMYQYAKNQAIIKYPELRALEGKAFPAQWNDEWGNQTFISMLPPKTIFEQENKIPSHVEYGVGDDQKQTALLGPGGIVQPLGVPTSTRKDSKDNAIEIFKRGQNEKYLREKGRLPTDEELSNDYKTWEAERAGLTSAARATESRKALGFDTFDNWTEEEKENTYQRVLAGESKPSFGFGAAAQSQKLAFERGYSGWLEKQNISGIEAQSIKEQFQSDKYSLRAITKAMDGVVSFENRAQESLKIIEDLADKYNRGMFPDVNRWVQIFSEHAGDPDIKALRNAIQTSMTEYMKVITAGTGISVAELSVGAQERTNKLLKEFDNPEAMKNQLNVYRREMEVSRNGLINQRGDIIDRMQNTLRNRTISPLTPSDYQQSSTSPTASGGKQVARTGKDKTGRRVIVYTDGSWEYGK